MFGLPPSTEKKQQLPKKAIYAKFDLKASQRENFDADISHINIVNIISSVTLPALSAGESVKEFYVLALQMKHMEYDIKNIMLLIHLIPQKMILALQYENQTKFAVFHTKLIMSGWQRTDQASLPLFGLTLDIIWENIVKEIGQIEVTNGNTLSDQIIADERKEKLHAQIAALERKLANEKQPRRKREYFEQIKKLKEQLWIK